MAATGRHVLVVEDAEELRALFRDVLADEGYRVSLAEAAPGLDDIVQMAPDLVVLDLLLGEDEEAAWRLLQGMRRDLRLAAVPILVCSAATHLLQRLEPELRALGAGVVRKPFELEEFLGAVDELMRPAPGEARGAPLGGR